MARSIHLATAREVLGIRERWEDAPGLTANALQTLTGVTVEWDREAALEKRLDAARRIAAKFAR
jgi:hypothetical protein